MSELERPQTRGELLGQGPVQALAGRPHSDQPLQFGVQELALFQEAETTLTPLPIGTGRCILPAGAEKRQIDLNRTGDQLPSHPMPNFPELRVGMI